MDEHVLYPWADLDSKASYMDRDLMKATMQASDEEFQAVVGPSTYCSQNVGNTYTGAVFANLLSLIDQEGDQLTDQRVGVFSYGSGAIATLYGLQVRIQQGTYG